MIARSYLYVPANNSDMLEKAISRGADALIIDLEDAVAMPEKALARINFAKWLEKVETEQQIWVRINADSILEDLEFANSSKITGIVVPKATIANLTQVAQSIGASMQISALIETADSILNAKSLAMVDKVSFLQIGVLDLRAELGLSMDGDSVTLQYAFAQLVLASAAAKIQQPIAPIFRDFNDQPGLRASCQQLKTFGFFGRTAIHPRQITVINEEFSTSAAELMQAHRVIAAISTSNGAAVDESGKMIDEAAARIARRVIKRAG